MHCLYCTESCVLWVAYCIIVKQRYIDLDLAVHGMATGGGWLSVTVHFQAPSRTVLHLPKNIKVADAIVEAAKAFKVKPEELTFMYNGAELNDDQLVGVSVHIAGV